ncbi:restriction endonuclease subunit S [Pseudomonas benzenivorans]|uniref:Restriction endonuclease subunit S n=1 Tax=Pseudomonas benzenivorans TaxID=556533 RepID=A0ABZ0PUA2_9PSED|nr:restriction endonuclease subunit S [Pseudomonas benzenivorans]WPC04712.1 restriction endonuclease subunit S [Pseudomonas benzenivorans]
MSWKSVALADVSDVFNGKTPSKGDQRGVGHPVLKIKDVGENGSFKGPFESFVDPGLADKFSDKHLELDDSLILNAAHNSDYVGSKQYRAEQAVVGSLPTGEWLIARANTEKLNPRFLNYWLQSPQARFQIKQLVKGIHLYPKDVMRLEIPLPPLPEQKRIAAILDKADAIRRKRQQAIQLADDFLRALFLDMFGDPVTNPKGWEVRPSGELFSVPPRIGTTTPADGQGYLVVRVGEIGKLDINFSKCGRAQLKDSELERFILRSGDTVLARAIGSKKQLGKASFFSGYSEDVYIDSHVMRLRPNVKMCNPEWFYRFVSSDGGKSLLQKAGGETAVQFNINAKQAASILIPLPPIELQNEFIVFCQRHSKSKTHLSKQAGDFEMLFSSLSQKAFSGQL